MFFHHLLTCLKSVGSMLKKTLQIYCRSCLYQLEVESQPYGEMVLAALLNSQRRIWLVDCWITNTTIVVNTRITSESTFSSSSLPQSSSLGKFQMALKLNLMVEGITSGEKVSFSREWKTLPRGWQNISARMKKDLNEDGKIFPRGWFNISMWMAFIMMKFMRVMVLTMIMLLMTI